MKFKRNARTYLHEKHASNAWIIAIVAVIITLIGFSMKNEIDSQTVETSQSAADDKIDYNVTGDSSQATLANKELYSSPTPSPPPTAKPSPHPSASPKPTKKPEDTKTYIVTIRDGRVSVLDEEKDEVVISLDAPANILPEDDIRLLEKGIIAEGLSEARRILEDYH